MLIPVQAAGALLLFLLSYWLFFSYGATDLALASPFDDVFPFLLAIPYLGCPLLILALEKLDRRVVYAVKLGLVIAVCSILLVLLFIVGSFSVFSSRWTWAYNDLRELHYLVPSLEIITYTAAVCLVFLTCYEFLTASKGTSGTLKKPEIVMGFCIILLGFAGFGAFQGILATQPLWVSLCILVWLAVAECSFILLHQWQSLKRFKEASASAGATDGTDQGPSEHHGDSSTRTLSIQERIRIRTFKGWILAGVALWCMYVALYPAQLVFQEGPTNSWGTSVLVGTAISFILLLVWWYCKVSITGSFLTIVLISLLSPILLALDFATIPNTVPAAQTLSLAGFISSLAWILFYGHQQRARWSPKLTLLATWLWGAGFVLFFHDPLLEIWEMEEYLLKLQIRLGTVTDPFRTGVGLYYPLLLLIGLIGLAFASVIFLVKYFGKTKATRKTPATGTTLPSTPVSTVSMPAKDHTGMAREASTRLYKKQFYASLVIFAVAFSSSLILTQTNIATSAPVIVAEMGDHGVLWLANSYDRVLPDYHPDFSVSPRNSTVDIHAMRGEAELVQLVFSPLASRMISFQGYQWSSSAAAAGDNKWKAANDSLVEIPIRTGQVGYINCFNPDIADVLLPWKSFITGAETRANVPFWLEIQVPRNVSAGTYTTRFEYITRSYLQRVARDATLNFTLQLTVWDVLKPLNRTVDTVIGLWPENPQYADQLLKLGMNYSVDPYGIGVSIYGPYCPAVSWNPANLSAGIQWNWSRFYTRVQEMLDAGMNQIKLDFYPGIDCRSNAQAVLNGSKDNFLTLIRWFYENVTTHLENRTTPWNTTWASETITQHSDEPDPRIDPLAPKAFDLVYQIVHNASQGQIRSFQTFMYEPAFDEWLDSLDIWVLTPDSFSPEVSALIHGAGHEVWTYSNGDNFPGTDTDLRTPLIMSRLRGWVDYHYNISGFLHWTFYFYNYNDAGRSGCGYDGRGDGTEIVPYEDGYLPTLRLAAFRDGLEDNELLWMLNRTIADAQAKNVSSAILDEAISSMNAVDAALGRQWADTQWPIPVVTREFNHDAREYIGLRTRCGDILDALDGSF